MPDTLTLMTKPLAETLAANVRAEMWRQNVSSRTMAKVLGLSPQQMSERLRGLVEIRPNELQKIAEELGKPVGWFLGVPSEEPAA